MFKRWISIVMVLFFIVANIPQYAYADSIDEWNVRNPMPTGDTLYDVAYGNGTYVAVGDSGTIVTSSNGTDWTNRKSGVGESLSSVAFGKNMFVAVGGGGTILSSSDGVTWTKQSSTTGRALNRITFGNNMFMAVGTSGTIITSGDGTSWANQSIGSTASLLSVIFAANSFVVVGNGGAVFTSPNGTAWTSRNSGTTDHLSGVAYGNNMFVAAGLNGTILTSVDGSTWVKKLGISMNNVSSIAFGSSTFVVVDGITGFMFTTPNVTNWTSRPSDTLNGLKRVNFLNNRFVAVGVTGTILISPNGTDWTSATSPMTNTLNGVAYGNSAYVAAGNTGTIMTSGNGTEWTRHASGTTNTLNGVAYGNGRYVAVGNSGTILTSRNGTDWAIKNSGTTKKLNRVAFGNGKYVAVGDTGAIITSSDGDTWTNETSDTTDHLYGVTYGNGEYVAVGNNGTIITSSDGVGWTSQTSNTTSTLYDVVYGDGKYVAVGSFGTIVTSNDGVSWAILASVSSNDLRGVAYGNGKYVASGNFGIMFASGDGSSWESQTTGTGKSLFDVTYGRGTYVAVGSTGMILQTPPIPAMTYTVSYEANGATSGSVPIDNVAYAQGEPVTLLGNTGSLVMTDFTFEGWNTESDGSGTRYAPGSVIAMGTANITLYAEWTANPVTPIVTYAIAAITDQTLTALTQGYDSGIQETRPVSIANTGTGDLNNLTVTLSGTNANDFVTTQPSSSLTRGTASGFDIKAKDGLPAGTYKATVTIAADHMTPVTFIVTQAVNSPNAPANPQNLVASGGDRQVALSWDPVPNAAQYRIYMATDSSQSTAAEVTTVTSATYNVQHLVNGTTYYFVVKSENSGGLSAASNQASATPSALPGEPTRVMAVAGDGQAVVSFTAPADNGGNPITGYEVIASPGNTVVIGSVSPITLTGLTNGTSYTFTVKAISGAGKSAASVPSNAVIPRASSRDDDNSLPSQPSAPTASGGTKTGIDILVNGKAESAGTAAISKRNDQIVKTISVDQKRLEDKLAAEGQGTVVTIPFGAESDVMIGELNGQMVRSMENKQAVVTIKTDHATYTIPAQQIQIGAIADQLGKSVALQDIKVQIEIAAPTADTLKVVENAAAKGTFAIVVPSLDFTIRAAYGNTSVEVSKFNAYVERTVAIPDGVDPNKITTGVVVDPDGTVRHVPTKIVIVDGKYYARINSLTNSTYSVVWHPLEFSDVTKHWAKDAVNDMGSRMVIDGMGDGLFSPDQDITRAEFAAILVRGLGLKPEKGAAPFSDVKETDWYSSAVSTAYSYRLIDGFEDGAFRPNEKITREQAMTILSKAMAITGLKDKLSDRSADATLKPYKDAAQVSVWAQSGIADSVKAGVVSGRTDGTLAPKAYMTRAEVATIIRKLLQTSELI